MGLLGLVKPSKDQSLYKKAASGNIKGIKDLHARGAGLEWKDKYGRTALASACFYCPTCYPPLDVVKTLIDLGADGNTSGSDSGTPLHYIAGNEEFTQNEQLAKLLLANGADAHVKNDDGQTPLDIARARHNGTVVRAIEGHICLFSGWMREFYGDSVANRLDTRDIWVVVLPCSSSTPSKPFELKLAIYSATPVTKTLKAGAKPRTIIALRKAESKKLNVNQDDPAVVISYNSKGSKIKIKLGPAKAGDKQQLQWFSNACKGIAQEMQPANPVQPQVPAVAGTTAEESELAMAIKASLQSPVEDMLPYCGTQTQVVSEAHASTSLTSSSENTNHNGSAALDVPASREGTSNGSKFHDFGSNDNLSQHMDTEPDLPAVFYKTFESSSLVSAPSAPPIPDAIIDDGPIHYPSIDSTPIDFYSQYVESSSTIAAEMKKEAGTTCSICWDSPVEGAFLPCGHMAGCMSCSNDIKARNMGCPVCRANVDQVTRIYISSLTEKKDWPKL